MHAIQQEAFTLKVVTTSTLTNARQQPQTSLSSTITTPTFQHKRVVDFFFWLTVAWIQTQHDDDNKQEVDMLWLWLVSNHNTNKNLSTFSEGWFGLNASYVGHIGQELNVAYPLPYSWTILLLNTEPWLLGIDCSSAPRLKKCSTCFSNASQRFLQQVAACCLCNASDSTPKFPVSKIREEYSRSVNEMLWLVELSCHASLHFL